MIRKICVIPQQDTHFLWIKEKSEFIITFVRLDRLKIQFNWFFWSYPNVREVLVALPLFFHFVTFFFS